MASMKRELILVSGGDREQPVSEDSCVDTDPGASPWIPTPSPVARIGMRRTIEDDDTCHPVGPLPRGAVD